MAGSNEFTFVNSFNGGIDQDTSIKKYSNETYYDAEDLRIISKNSLSNGALTNIPGNAAKIKFSNYENEEVVASSVVSDKLVLFTKMPVRYTMDLLTSLPNQGLIKLSFNGNTYTFKIISIWEYPNPLYLDYILTTDSTNDRVAYMFNKHKEITDYFRIYIKDDVINLVAKGYDTNIYNLTIVYPYGVFERVKYGISSSIYTVPNYKDIDNIVSASLKFSDAATASKLNFNTKNPISIVGRVESELLEKIYWVNGVDPLRSMNILDSFSNVRSSDFDYIPNVTLTRPLDTIISGGGLKSGVIQYSYQYYNKNGSSTVFSPTDDIIRLANQSETSIGGSGIGSDANKSVKLSINNLDYDFNRVRIISIFYDALNSTPLINIIAEIPFTINDTSVSVIDNGSSLGSITIEEYNLYNQTTYIPKVLESKDNILFIGNVVENTFSSTAIDDWDSRAYSFNKKTGTIGDGTTFSHLYNTPLDSPTGERYEVLDNGVVRKYNSSNILIETLDAPWDVPVDHNCVNLNNSIFSNNLAIGQMFYPGAPINGENILGYVTSPYDTNTIYGGLGKNVLFTFLRYCKSTSNYDKSDRFISTVTTQHPAITGQDCQPNEVYRIGIKFFNNKGQSSFVKWIADIRWPSDGLTLDTNYYYSPMLNVKVKTFPLDTSIVGYQIVRAERKSSDMSIVDTGLISPIVVGIMDSDVRVPSVLLKKSNTYDETNSELVEFISPESIFNNANNINKVGSKLVIAGYTSGVGALNQIPDSTQVAPNAIYNYYSNINYNSNLAYEYTTPLSVRSHTILESIDVSPVHNEKDVYQKVNTVSKYKFKNQFNFGGSIAARCSSPVFLLDSSLQPSSEAKVPIAHIVSNKDLSRYGGYSIADRGNTVYIQFSGYIKRTTVSTTCEYGDIFRHKFSIARALFYRKNTGTFAEPEWSKSYSQLISMHLPSRIACAYRSDDIEKYFFDLSTVTDVNSLDNIGFLQETVVEGLRLYPDTYEPVCGDLYKYNSVYSQQPNINISIAKPTEFNDNFISPTKILASDKKINSETNDSWLNFFANELIEVDGQFGELTALKSFKGKLLFFQKNAIGLLSVNDRTLIQDGSLSSLSLGTGDVLQRFDYISYFSGVDVSSDIISSKTNIYFIDANSKRIYTIDSPDTSFSEVSGVHSLLNTLITDTNRRLCGFDAEYNEVLFTIGDKTLCYNENIKNFTSMYNFIPDYYITTPKALFSHKNDFNYFSKNYVYRHNAGNIGSWYNELYGNSKSTSKITLLINPRNGGICSFDSLGIRSEVYLSNDNSPFQSDIIQETISRAKFSNSYIDEISVESALGGQFPKIKRLVREWHMQVPLTENSNRFTDSYLLLTLEFDNNSNKLFKLHDVITKNRLSHTSL